MKAFNRTPATYAMSLLTVALLSLSACSKQSQTEPVSESISEPKLVSESTPATDANQAESTLDDAAAHEETVTEKNREAVAPVQLISHKKVGSFLIGEKINAGKQPTGEMVKKKTITRMEEGEKVVYDTYEVYANNQLVLEIEGNYDLKTNQTTNTIGEIVVLSPTYKTVQGIGVGSLLSQVLDAYPQGLLYYSYVCDCIWLEDGKDHEMQFHLDPAAYKKVLPTHADSMEIQPADMSSEATIYKVRIYGVPTAE